MPWPRSAMVRTSSSLAPGDEPAFAVGAVGVRAGAEGDIGGLADGVLEVGGGDAGREADDRVGVVCGWCRRGGAGRGSGRRRVPGTRRPCRAAGGRGQVFGRPGDAAVLGELDEVAFDVLLGAAPQFPGGGIPDDVGGVVVAVRAQRLAEARIAGGVAAVAGQGPAVRAGRRRRGGGGRVRACSGSGALPAQVWARTGREWTGPKDGAVKVANTTGCPATVSGMPLPPASPARMRWKASRR